MSVLHKSKIYDISVPLKSGMVVWHGDTPFRREIIRDISKGDPNNVSAISLSCHTGSHVDAPHHFINDGVGIEGVPLSILLGPARVVELLSVDRVTEKSLQELDLDGVERLLLKTRNSNLLNDKEFIKDFVSVEEDAANYIIERHIKLLGVDYLSVEGYGYKQKPVHHILLSKGVVVVETLDLSNVPAGDYELICLPLNIPGSDGAPARVILRTL